MTRKEQCVVQVYGHGSFTGHRCAKAAKVERDGRWYCGTHDPERVAAYEAARRQKWAREDADRVLAMRVKDAEAALVTVVMAFEPRDCYPPALHDAYAAVKAACAAVAASRSSQGANER